jgi:hypothetical protein
MRDPNHIADLLMKNLFGSPTLVKSCWNLSFIAFKRAVAFAASTISQTHLATHLVKVIAVMASPTGFEPVLPA